MYKGEGILCLIPARGGSKGLPGKNIKPLAGKPLLAYTIEHAKKSKYIDRVVLSTDDQAIAQVALANGAEVPFMRPKKLGGDRVGTIDVLLHGMDWIEKNEKYDFTVLVNLHVTTPLRTSGDIDACIELLFREKADNVFSVTDAHRNPYFNMVEIGPGGKVRLVKKGSFTSRQAAPRVFDMNASIYVWRKKVLKNKKSLFLPNTRIYRMPKERSVDIDDALDFKVAEMLMMNVPGKDAELER
ncbi:MAG: acylneuraminate cytidylyltransferase family protein [Desulfobacteraceae bacterium]|nr:MAG: acylneuraminate cytidylyltransferase family protein [Desulfobacteraceae bacterium]